MRLIDADENRDEFMEFVYDVLADDETNDRANQIIDFFCSIPTAYDVDKVVEQLQRKVNEYRIMESVYKELPTKYEMADYFSGKANAYEKAIEIVKGGGVDGC